MPRQPAKPIGSDFQKIDESLQEIRSSLKATLRSRLTDLLNEAASAGYVEIMPGLIRKGAAVNGKEDESTPLYKAVVARQRDAAELLIEKGADVHKLRPVMKAVKNGDIDMVRLLVEKGANIQTTRHKLSLAERSPLHEAAAEGKLNIARFLIDSGADVNAYSFNRFETPLHEAVRASDTKMADLLIESGAKIEITCDPWQTTPLDLAVEDDDIAMADFLIKKGARVRGLYRAVYAGAMKMAAFLIEKGAGVDNGRMADITPLMDAVRGGHKNMAAFLIEKGANVNGAWKKGCSQDTPLLWAVKYNGNATDGGLGMAALLIEKGADVNLPNYLSNTPLDHCDDRPKMARLLKANGGLRREELQHRPRQDSQAHHLSVA